MRGRPTPEQRKRPRLPLSFPLFARGTDLQGKPFKELLTALNVSASGMLAIIAPRFNPPRHLQLEMALGAIDDEARPITREVRAEVVRREQRARSRLVGLKFERPIA